MTAAGTAGPTGSSGPDRRRPPGPAAPRRGSPRLLPVLGALLLAVAALGGALLLAAEQRDSRDELSDRFAARGALSAEFVATYARQLLAREREVATATLAGRAPEAALEPVAQAFGFRSALLLDARGRVLAAFPAAPGLLGSDATAGAAHRSDAVAGRPSASRVLPPGAEPGAGSVVEFAAPYETTSGRRVLVGAFDTRDTPLRDYLEGFSSLAGYRGVVVDDAGVVIASSDPRLDGRLADRAPLLAGRATTGPGQGEISPDGVRRFFAVHAVTGTPWQLATDVPVTTLLHPVSGAGRLLPWTILGALVLAAAVAYALALRLLDGRRRLQAANRRLDDLANRDGLTGVANRRRLTEALGTAVAEAQEEGGCVSVLVLDVDLFKRVNDTFGHSVGDDVLRAVARRLADAVRAGDLLGRWGGEEFLVVLPATGPQEAVGVGERLRRAVAAGPVPVGTGGDEIDVTVSVGVAGGPDGPEVLVASADRALYAAKAAGRNAVVAAGG